MDGEQQLEEGKIKELVGTILSHPLFRETLNSVFNNSSSTPAAQSRQSNVMPTSSVSQSTTRSTSRSSSTTPSSSAMASTSRYATPAEEFSALFRRGSSRGSTPTFQRGVNHRQSHQAARVRRRTASAPYTQRSNCPRARNEIFRTKEVVLLPDSKAERVVRAPEKANLMERGFVLNKLLINKTWSDQKVIEYFEECFTEKLTNAAVVSTDVGSTPVSSRY